MTEPPTGRPGGPIGIAGTGRVARALGRLLRERGEPVVAVAGRNPAKTGEAAVFVGSAAVPLAELAQRAQRVLIAVADEAIPEVAAILAKAGMRHGAALHTCGGSGPEVLAGLAAQGVAVGAIHPLQTVASPEQGVQGLPGVAFAIDGDPPATAWAERIAGVLGGAVLRVPAERRRLYHAAAVIAGNYTAGLVDAAVLLLRAAGIEESTALRALRPLAQSSLTNAFQMGPLPALTGPIQRGDVETVAGHLEALAGAIPHSLGNLYRAAGLHVLDMARRRGLYEERARAIETLLREKVDGRDP